MRKANITRKFKLLAIWRIFTSKAFYVVTERGSKEGMWNTSSGLNTQQARIIIKSLQKIIEDTDDSEKFLSDVKSIITQKNDKP